MKKKSQKGTQHHIMSHIWLITKHICVNMKNAIHYQLEREYGFQNQRIEI